MSVQSGGIGDTGWILDIVNDTLLVTAASSQLGESLTINYRFARKDSGENFSDSQILSLAAGDRSVKQIVYSFQGNKLFQDICANDVYLTDVSIQAAVATTRGQTFARVNLVRQSQGLSTAPTKCAILSDYVTQQVSACLRNARHFTSTEGQGWIHSVQSVYTIQPQWKLQVPVNARWKVICGFGVLQTTNTPGTRQIGINITSIGGATIFADGDIAPIPSNSQADFTYSRSGHIPLFQTVGGVNFNALSLDAGGRVMHFLKIPIDLTMLPTDTLLDSSFYADVNDSWALPTFQIEEWLDNV